jgi:hypothetical protein
MRLYLDSHVASILTLQKLRRLTIPIAGYLCVLLCRRLLFEVNLRCITFRLHTTTQRAALRDMFFVRVYDARLRKGLVAELLHAKNMSIMLIDDNKLRHHIWSVCTNLTSPHTSTIGQLVANVHCAASLTSL